MIHPNDFRIFMNGLDVAAIVIVGVWLMWLIDRHLLRRRRDRYAR